MSTYDTIQVNCPACSTPLSFQSKSGDCALKTYSLWSAPPDVVIGTAEEFCKKCGRIWKLVLPPVSPIIREVPFDPSNEEDDGA